MDPAAELKVAAAELKAEKFKAENLELRLQLSQSELRRMEAEKEAFRFQMEAMAARTTPQKSARAPDEGGDDVKRAAAQYAQDAAATAADAELAATAQKLEYEEAVKELEAEAPTTAPPPPPPPLPPPSPPKVLVRPDTVELEQKLGVSEAEVMSRDEKIARLEAELAAKGSSAAGGSAQLESALATIAVTQQQTTELLSSFKKEGAATFGRHLALRASGPGHRGIDVADDSTRVVVNRFYVDKSLHNWLEKNPFVLKGRSVESQLERLELRINLMMIHYRGRSTALDTFYGDYYRVAAHEWVEKYIAEHEDYEIAGSPVDDMYYPFYIGAKLYKMGKTMETALYTISLNA